MSLPLSRRIARAALLVAAGATPLAAAGAASAADLMPKGTDLGAGISKLDGITSSSTVKGEAHQVGQALGKTGSVLAATALPATADLAGMAAAQTLPSTEDAARTVADPGTALTNATTNGSGPLADTLGKVSRLTPLGHLLPGAAPRSMPLGVGQPVTPHAPAMPSVTGVDKLVSGDALSNPLGAAHHLTQQVPAASGLTTQLPTQDRLVSALPNPDHLTGALPAGDLSSTPSTQQLTQAVPSTATLADVAPATHGLAGHLTAADQLTHAVPAADLTHPTEAVDAAHLTALAGQATSATHRLSSLPDLSGVNALATSLGGGVTNALHHLPSVG
ncbi:hypothetical protein [Kitasatospora acidiphila]|uniref:hypothetical protein n=1 Tax=Kitasatospora acidiphila TaxID=2567942 RepID=UPI003C74B2C8